MHLRGTTTGERKRESVSLLGGCEESEDVRSVRCEEVLSVVSQEREDAVQVSQRVEVERETCATLTR